MQSNLKIISQRVKQTMSTLPYKVGVLMVAFTKDRFKYRNWIDTYPEAWKPRSRRTWGKKKNDAGRALLVKSGRLRRSIRIIATTTNSVTIGSDVPYAKAQNDGFRGAVHQVVNSYTRRQPGGKKQTVFVTGHNRKIQQNIPARKFMGKSLYLQQQISRLITAEINKCFK